MYKGESIMLCNYGCGQEAHFQMTNGKWCCKESFTKCPEIKRKNREANKKGHKATIFENSNDLLCNYGCGRIAKYRFKNGKVCCEEMANSCPEKAKRTGLGNKGKILSEKTKELYRFQRTAEKNPMYGKKHKKESIELMTLKSWKNMGRDNPMKNKHHSEETRKLIGIKSRDYMLNGGSVYVASFIKNPSKPQVELYNRVKDLYPSAILNYPCYRGKGKRNYSLDVAIPELKIWFESDGAHWHQDLEKDLKRQKEVEELGWKIIRYKADNVSETPSKEQIEYDINVLLDKYVENEEVKG